MGVKNLALVALAAVGPVGVGAVTCDACGESASYSEELGFSTRTRKREITASGCPNHYSFCSGKSIRGCGGHGGEGSETKADVLNLEYTIPANPVIAATVDDFECSMGAIGIALNGVQIYGGAVERLDDDDPGCELLDVTGQNGEWWGFDFCSGHTGGANGFNPYHYHFPPSCLIDQAGAKARGADHRVTTATTHSPQVGWSLDGFPVYGNRGADGVEMKQVAGGGSGANLLDECSGREEALPGVDEFLYRYYFTGTTSDLMSLPSSPMPANTDYPFSFRCYKGCTWSDIMSGTRRCANAKNGTSPDYVAQPVKGITDKYVSAEATKYWYNKSGDAAMAPQCASAPSMSPTTETLAPTTAAARPQCYTQTSDETDRCAATGGSCYTTEAHCTADGGVFLPNFCGGDECGCCVKRPSTSPTPAPTPRPTPAPITLAPTKDFKCASMTDSQDDKCSAKGGQCLNSNVTCVVDQGGVFLENLCGNKGTCGCCLNRPSSAPTTAAMYSSTIVKTAGISSLYAMIALGGAGVVVVGLTAKTVQQQKEHTALVQKMRRHQQSEMVAPPTLV